VGGRNAPDKRDGFGRLADRLVAAQRDSLRDPARHRGGRLSLDRPAGGDGRHRTVRNIALFPLLAALWGLFLYVRLGVRKNGGSIRELISARPLDPRSLAADLLLGLVLLVTRIQFEQGVPVSARLPAFDLPWLFVPTAAAAIVFWVCYFTLRRRLA
jgi:hypothetical protein